jgi:hypothetical protein
MLSAVEACLHFFERELTDLTLLLISKTIKRPERLQNRLATALVYYGHASQTQTTMRQPDQALSLSKSLSQSPLKRAAAS